MSNQEQLEAIQDLIDRLIPVVFDDGIYAEVQQDSIVITDGKKVYAYAADINGRISVLAAPRRGRQTQATEVALEAIAQAAKAIAIKSLEG